MTLSEISKIDFSFEGDPEIIRESAVRALAVLPATISTEQRRRLLVGLEEILLNAWEHGVLGIRTNEKAELLEQGILESERRNRHIALAAHERLIRVESSFDGGVFRCTVRDPGKGFDWKSVAEAELPAADQLNGRGIKFVSDTFDYVEWNEPGNSVSVSWSEVSDT